MTQNLWTASEIAAATSGRASSDFNVNGISIDTRSLQPGDLFVALSAARDGHDFVAAALAAGAAGALVSRVPDGVAADAPLIMVPDVQTALHDMGRAARLRTKARVAAITGSVGKTTTKDMLCVLCAQQGRSHASVASYNNHWGVPLTLARMPRDTDYAVIEIGMNHPGEIAPLAQMAQPDVALVTTVAPAHLEAFGSLAGIADEKAAIFTGLSPNGTAIYFADLPTSDRLANVAKHHAQTVIGFGADHGDARLLSVQDDGVQLQCRAIIADQAVEFSLTARGLHFAMNALGVLCAARALGLDLRAAAKDLSLWTPEGGRGAIYDVALQNGTLRVVDDAYNANPASMAAAIETLAQLPATRRIAVLGDMKELGPDAAQLHAQLADLPAMQQIDQVHTVGPLAQSLNMALPKSRQGLHVDRAQDLMPDVPNQLQAGDAVLVKASNSMGLRQIVDLIRQLGQTDINTTPITMKERE